MKSFFESFVLNPVTKLSAFPEETYFKKVFIVEHSGYTYIGCLEKSESIEIYKGDTKVKEVCAAGKMPIGGVISSQGHLVVPTLCERVLLFELSDPLQPTQIAEVRVR